MRGRHRGTTDARATTNTLEKGGRTCAGEGGYHAPSLILGEAAHDRTGAG